MRQGDRNNKRGGKGFSRERRAPYPRPRSGDGVRGKSGEPTPYQKRSTRPWSAGQDKASTPYKKRDGDDKSFSKERRSPYPRARSGDGVRGKSGEPTPF